ncbi:MAG TPA: hypothetical protein VFW80_07665 [Gaiellaceae bacterium]|nr:hypothetical protein [Gaiellaceae bacterium]
MAGSLSHAAGQERYEVREFPEGQAFGPEVRHECRDYVQAVEFAFELLQRRDPRREGLVNALEVVKVEQGHRETVWSYEHARDTTRVDPVRKWGFDVTRTWSGPARPSTRPVFGRLQQRRA